MTSSVSESPLSSEATSRSMSISVPGFSLFEGTLFSSAHLPQGLATLVESLAREVVRSKPNNIYSFAAHHFDYLLQSRTTRAGEKNASNSDSTLRRNYCGADLSIESSSFRARNNPPNPKKKSNIHGWSIRETSRILNKEPAVAISCENQCQSQNASGQHHREQHSKNSSRGPSLSGEAGKHLDARAVTSSQAQREIIRRRSGSFEFVDADDAHESQETTRLLRSISFDCILPKRMFTTPSKKIHSIHGIDTVRCTSATSDYVSSSLGTKAKDNNNRRGSIFLPAVRPTGFLSPAASLMSSNSSSVTSSSSSSPSSLFPFRDQPKSCPVRENGALTLPLIKYELAKSAKKCNAILLPAVDINKPPAPVSVAAAALASAPAPEDSGHSETQSFGPVGSITKVEHSKEDRSEEKHGTTTDKAEMSNEHLAMNELGKKLLELHTVEKNIERTLVLGGISGDRATIIKIEAGGEHRSRRGSAGNAQDLSSERRTDRSDDFCDKIFGDHLCPPTDHCGQSSQQLEKDCIGLTSVPHRLIQTIGNIVTSASIELDEIIEEAEDESVEISSEYESRLVHGIAEENVGGRAALLNGEKASAQQNRKSRALEDIAEREEKDEKETVGASREVIRNSETKKYPDAEEVDDQEEMKALPAVVDGHDDSTLEEEIAKELIANGRHSPEKDNFHVSNQSEDIQTLDTESERSTASPRVCHTGEFHDSLPLSLIFCRIDSRNANQTRSASFSSDETPGQTTKPLKNRTSSSKMNCFSRGNGDLLRSSQVVPLGRHEQDLTISTASTSQADVSVIPLIRSIVVGKYPQDEAALSTLLRAIHTGIGMIHFTPLINLSPCFYPMSTNAYTLFEDSTPSNRAGGTTLAIEEIRPASQNLEEEAQMPIGDTCSSIPIANNLLISSEENESLEQHPASTNANQYKTDEVKIIGEED